MHNPTITKAQRHAILDEAFAVATELPQGASLRCAFADHLEERLYEALPVLAILRNCAKASYEIDIDRHEADHPGDDVDLLIDASEQTRLFDVAHEAALRAFVFGHRV